MSNNYFASNFRHVNSKDMLFATRDAKAAHYGYPAAQIEAWENGSAEPTISQAIAVVLMIPHLSVHEMLFTDVRIPRLINTNTP